MKSRDIETRLSIVSETRVDTTRQPRDRNKTLETLCGYTKGDSDDGETSRYHRMPHPRYPVRHGERP